MFWLRSSICQVLPPFSERYSPFSGGTASMKAYTISGLDGATLTATRPHGFGGSPDALVDVSSVQVAPPSVLLNSPEPLRAVSLSPPERNVQPRRRKSHIPAYRVLGCDGSIVIIEQPVDALAPLRTLAHVLPPSVVLYTPRSSLSLHSLPGTQSYTVLVSWGSTRIFTMCSDSRSPMLVQLSPPSSDR